MSRLILGVNCGEHVGFFFFFSVFAEGEEKNCEFVTQNWKRWCESRTRDSSRTRSLEDVETVPRGRIVPCKIAFAISPVKELACMRKAKPEPVIRRRGRSGSRKRKLVKFR